MERQKILVISVTSVAIKTVSLSDLPLIQYSNTDTENSTVVLYCNGNVLGWQQILKLQQKLNELQNEAEDLRDEKKSLSLRVKELEDELEGRPDKAATQRTVDELHSKLLAAETLCEELMDENEDMKKELRDMEEEIEEMQDNFRYRVWLPNFSFTRTVCFEVCPMVQK